jgi:hypothetical protein
MSQLHAMKVEGNAHFPTGGYVSGRAGTRKTRTLAKTARANGHDYTPTQGWRERSQGMDSAKVRRAKEVKGMKKQAQETVKGDVKKA